MEYFIVCPERMKDDKKYVYWKADANGYTENVEEAGRYSKEEADKICNAPFVDDFAIPVCDVIKTRYRVIHKGE